MKEIIVVISLINFIMFVDRIRYLSYIALKILYSQLLEYL